MPGVSHHKSRFNKGSHHDELDEPNHNNNKLKSSKIFDKDGKPV